MKRNLRSIVLILAGLFILIQFIPYGREHANPPIISEPQWGNPAAEALARRACYECHSNESVWPWYSNVAPVSWLVYRDVTQGRKHINFSDWNRPEEQHVDEFGEVQEADSMPPFFYLWMHPEARLSDSEKTTLYDGLAQLMNSYMDMP